MKTKTIIVALATLLIGSLCFQACQKDEILSGKPDMTEHNALKRGQAEPKMVPFRGSGTWQAVAFSEPDFEEMEIEITVKINGTATHLGRLEGDWTGLYKFEVLLDENGEPVIDPDTGYPVIIPTDYLWHTTTYTAANGDKLYDAGCDEYFPDDDGIGFVMKGVEIVGGTGRFENAVGWYDIEAPATVGFPFPAGTWEFEGRISRPGR